MDMSLLWSDNVTGKVIASIDYHYLLLIPMAYSVLHYKWTDKILTAFLIGMLISEISSYGIYFEIWTLNHSSPSDPTPFMYHIEYSIFLSFTAILLLSRIISNYYSYKEKIFTIPFFLTVTFNLFITGGRSGQVAFLFGLAVIFILHYKLTIKSFFSMIFLALVIYMSAYSLSNTFHKRVEQTLASTERILQNKDLTTSIGIRVSFYIVTYEIVTKKYKNLLFGVGYNDVHDEINKLLDSGLVQSSGYKIDEKFLRKYNAHSQYLQILLQAGLLGVFIFIYFMFKILKAKYINQEIRDLSIIFSIIFLLTCATDTILELQFTRTLFVVMMSLFIINIKSTSKLGGNGNPRDRLKFETV
jgi:O-antigen ligase